MPTVRAITRGAMRPDRGGVVGSLLTSWFGAGNFTDEEKAEPPWVSHRRGRHVELDEDLRELGTVAEDDSTGVNSVIKLKLYPFLDQRLKLDQMFAAHRSVYNMAVAWSWKDCLPIFVPR
jgi:hypothetical protein